MKKPFYLLFWLFALVSLASCKKSYPDYQIVPSTSIIFDDLVDKVTADYKVGSTLNLKISAAGATSVTITSTYPVGSSTATQNLGTFPLTNGVATISIPANSLRATANGTPTGAPSGATTATRTANTYTLTVDATDGTNSFRRFYAAVLVQ